MEQEVLGEDGREDGRMPRRTPTTGAGIRPVRITGEVGGKMTIVCCRCFRDVHDGYTMGCRCGRAYCADCWSAGSCICGEPGGYQSERVQEAPQAPVSISLFDALGLEPLDPVLDGRPSLLDVRGHGLEYMEDEGIGGSAEVGHASNPGVQPALMCVACETSSLDISWGWVLCRCGAYLCAGCGPTHRAQCERGGERVEDIPRVTGHAMDADDADDADDIDGETTSEGDFLGDGIGERCDSVAPPEMEVDA